MGSRDSRYDNTDTKPCSMHIPLNYIFSVITIIYNKDIFPNTKDGKNSGANIKFIH